MEKRGNVRVAFHVRAVITAGERTVEGEVKNLSTGGILVAADDTLPVDTAVQVSIFLYGASSHLALNMDGRIVRAAGGELAVKFTGLDLDSFIHLRNIVARNAADDEEILKEYRRFAPSDQAGE